MPRIIIFLIFSVFLTNTTSAAEDNIESKLYSGFKPIKSFSSINVYLRGTAESIGLNKTELDNYLRLRFKNSFAKMDYKEVDFLETFEKTKDEKSGVGDISLTIWTVGGDYPIALHMEIAAGNYNQLAQYENAMLGYNSKQNIVDSVKKGISELMDDLAIAFFKARGEM